MKNHKLFFVLLLFAPILALAQPTQDEMEYFQSIYGMEKRALFENFIQLEGDAADDFWLLYDEYEKARKELGKNRVKLLLDYAENYDNLTPEKTDELMKAMIKQKTSLDKLTVTYYKKINKASGSKVAAQFFQLENYVLAGIRMGIMDSIPFIGELGN